MFIDRDRQSPDLLRRSAMFRSMIGRSNIALLRSCRKFLLNLTFL